MRYWNLVRNLKNWDLYLAVKFGLTGRDPLRFVTRSGVRVEAPRRLLPTFKEVFMAEDYRAVRPLPARGPVIVDIGANAGFFSLYAASRHPRARVLAFEPVPVNFRLLQTNRDLNPEHRLEIFERAVSGKDGTANLTFDPGDAFTTSAHLIPGPGGQGGVIPVACISLPTLFAENGLNHCDFLKMDCEGAEFDILYSTPPEILHRIRQLVMEVHPGREAGHQMDALEAFLSGHGFHTRRRPVDMLCAWRDA